MKTTVHNSKSRVGKRTKDTFQHNTPSLVEIELNEKDLPYFEHSNEGAHVATVTMRRKGKATRFFVRVLLVDGEPAAQLIALRQDREHNTERELAGVWSESLEQSLQARENEEENA